MSDLKSIENKIRKALRDQGTYTKDMDTAIYLAASNLLAHKVALRDIEGLEKSYIVELTREGNEKLVPHPAFKVLAATSEAVRKCLRELRLTLATVEASDDGDEDGISGLVNTVHGVT